MSRLKPLVRERFKSKDKAYDSVAIQYNGNRSYAICGIKQIGRTEYIYTLTPGRYSLKESREAIREFAEIQDGLPVLNR